MEPDVILMMLVKGVHGNLPCVRYLEFTPVNASRFMPEPRQAARTFGDLLVWRKAHEFVLAVYAFTTGFPKQETYGLSLQMRRAAVSIPANTARAQAHRRGIPATRQSRQSTLHEFGGR